MTLISWNGPNFVCRIYLQENVIFLPQIHWTRPSRTSIAINLKYGNWFYIAETASGCRPGNSWKKLSGMWRHYATVAASSLFGLAAFLFSISLFFNNTNKCYDGVWGPLNAQLLKSKNFLSNNFGILSWTRLSDTCDDIFSKCSWNWAKHNTAHVKKVLTHHIVAILYTCTTYYVLWRWAYFLNKVSNFDGSAKIYLLVLFFWRYSQYVCNGWRSGVTI